MEQNKADAGRPGAYDLKSSLQLEMKGRGIDALVEHVIAQNDVLEDLSQKLKHQYKRLTILQETVDVLSGLDSLAAEHFVNTVDIGAMMPLKQGHGFFSLEYDKRDVPFRWTGPKAEFQFTLYLKRDVERTLSINLMNFSLGKSADLRGWINGHMIEWDSISQQTEYTSYTVQMPALKEANTVTSLTFESPKTFRPQDTNPNSKDTRTLGVAFHSLTAV